MTPYRFRSIKANDRYWLCLFTFLELSNASNCSCVFLVSSSSYYLVSFVEFICNTILCIFYIMFCFNVIHCVITSNSFFSLYQLLFICILSVIYLYYLITHDNDFFKNFIHIKVPTPPMENK